MPPRQVLVIDDDPDSLRLTERMLRLGGYSVATAARPDFTPLQIAQLAPDLIVLDHWFAHERHVVPFLQRCAPTRARDASRRCSSPPQSKPSRTCRRSWPTSTAQCCSSRLSCM